MRICNKFQGMEFPWCGVYLPDVVLVAAAVNKTHRRPICVEIWMHMLNVPEKLLIFNGGVGGVHTSQKYELKILCGQNGTRPTSIRHRRTKFNSHGDLAHGICAPLMLNFNASRWWIQKLRSGRLWRRVVWWVCAVFSEDSTAFIFRGGEDGGRKFLRYADTMY